MRLPPPGPPPGPPSRPWELADPRKRIWLAFLMSAVLFVVVLGRVAELQTLKASEYEQIAAQQRTRTVTLVAHRGQLLDRQGRPLAYSADARSVFADPSEIEDPQEVADALEPILGIPAEDIAAKLGDRKKRFVYLARSVALEVADEVDAADLTGVGLLSDSRRVYPEGAAAANVVGFTGVDGNGLAGVESWFDHELAGKNGELVVQTALHGQRIPSEAARKKPATPGADFVLTIDRDVQFVAQRAIADQVARYRADSGTVVVVEPRTGRILAMATAPTVDPDNPSGSPVELRGNPAVSKALEPGSVGKVVTAAAALEEGVVGPGSLVVVPPSLQIYDKEFTDAHPHGTLRLTFAGVVAKSSNIGTIKVAQRLGEERLREYMVKFGFGTKTGLGFPGEGPGIVPPVKDWSGTSLGTIAIGNGVVVNAVQMVDVLATVANSGVRVTPSLVLEKRSPDGTVTPAPEPGRTRVVSERTASQLTAMLEAAVTPEGTAPEAAIPGYRVAGKTGTARRVVGGSQYYVANFAGFVPAENPRLAVAVVVQNPRAAIFGGTVAAPVFREVASYALTRMKVRPSQEPAPELQLVAQ